MWIAADLLQGGDLVDKAINSGGTIGVLVGTDIATHDKKVVRPTTFADLQASIGQESGNIWGIVVFGHGGTDGYLGVHSGTALGTDYGYQSSIINALAKQGFQVATSYAMQCYSFCVGTDASQPGSPTTKWREAWGAVSLDPHGYVGENVLMFDTGK